MRLITAENPIYFCKSEDEIPFPSPFWGFIWPGGLGLTKFITANPKFFKDKSVLDLGSGCGVNSIAAMKAGASRVIANDICPFACEAFLMNLELNEASCDDLSGITFHEDNKLSYSKSYFDQCDIVMCGDMLYDPALSTQIKSILCDHDMAICGDPQRAYCPQILDESKNLLASFDYGQDGFARYALKLLNASYLAS